MDLIVKEVNTPELLKDFIRFPDNLYKDCKYYIPSLHKNQFKTLSKKDNPAFEHCEARYWLVMKGPVIVGRVAGIINHRYNQERSVKMMRFGWLDFAEDQKIANTLLQQVETWAKEKGMTAVHGPLGFTSFDASGVLIEGFDEWPTSFGRYNFPYYNEMLLKAGYGKEVDWVEYNIKVPDEMPTRVLNAAQLIEKRYSVRNAALKSRKDLRKYGKQIFNLLNIAYKNLTCFSTLSQTQIENLTKEFLPFLNPDYVSIILNEKDEIVAFGIVMPSLAKAMKRAKGKMFPFGFLHLLWSLRINDTVDMMLIGVKPEYQNKGLHALMFAKIIRTLIRRGIRQVETTRELEDNHKVQQLWAGYETRQHKRARCYVKNLS